MSAALGEPVLTTDPEDASRLEWLARQWMAGQGPDTDTRNRREAVSTSLHFALQARSLRGRPLEAMRESIDAVRMRFP